MIPKLRNCQNMQKATGNICDRLPVAFIEAWIKSSFPNGTTSLNTTQILHKNKAWAKYLISIIL